MGKSTQFDRDDDSDVQKVATRTGPLGLVALMYIIFSILLIIVVGFLWWRS